MNKTKKIPYIISIDDDNDFNTLLKLILKNINIKSSITKTPKVFIEKLKRQTPDLCLIDLNLDVASGAGFQIIEAIRNTKGKEIPIFVMSRRNSDLDIKKAFDLGANDFITKPLDKLTFKAKLEKFLNIKILSDPLPMYAISQKNSACSFKIPFNLIEVTEEYFILESLNYIEKGQAVHLQGSMIEEITNSKAPLLFTIRNFEKDNQTNRYTFQAEYDYTNNEIRYACRRWLLLNSSF